MSVLNQLDIIIRREKQCNVALCPCLKELINVLDGAEYSLQLALEFVQGVCVVLSDHHCRLVDVAAEQLLRHLVENKDVLRDAKDAIAHLKYLTAFPLAVYSMDSLRDRIRFCSSVRPPKGTEFRPTGDFGRWFKVRLMDKRRWNAHLWMSWFQLKRNSPVVDESFVKECFVKHRAQLTRTDPCPDGGIDVVDSLGNARLVDPLDLIAPELDACVEGLNKMNYDLRGCSPKRTACFERTRGTLGQLGHVSEILNDFCHRDKPGPWRHLYRPDLWKMEYRPWVGGLQPAYNVIIRHFFVEKMFSRLIDPSDLLMDDSETFPFAEICGVLEPLKVRTISKGPGLDYWMCKPLQESLHTSLRRIPCFRLIGRPITATDVVDTFQERFLASVDYSGATDAVSQKLGYRILQYILLRSYLHPSLVELGLRSFGPHILRYPSRFSIPAAMQNNGQLMGSIMSFPILCLLNLITLRAAEYTTDFHPLDPLINGDDMAYSCPTTLFWEYQGYYANQIGLIPSVGKCYLSEHCATMNSVLFTRSGSRICQMDYCPVGLIHGKHKVGVRDTEEREEEEGTGLSGCLNVVISGSRSPKLMTERFLSYNRLALNSECKGRNIFLPFCLGGLGVSPPPRFKIRYTKAQLAEAHRNWQSYKVDHLRVGTRIGPRCWDEEKLSSPNIVEYHWTAKMLDDKPFQTRRWLRSDGELLSRSQIAKIAALDVFEVKRRFGLGTLNHPKGCEQAPKISVPRAPQPVVSRDCTDEHEHEVVDPLVFATWTIWDPPWDP